MKQNFVKSIVAVVVGGLTAYFNVLLIPCVVLFVVSWVDWCTGIAKAWVHKKLCSQIGAIGAIKKLAYGVVVCVGMTVDYIIVFVLSQFGVEMTGNCYVGLLVTVWLIVNELISILENVSQIGVPIPKFLQKIVGKLKVTTEKKGDEQNGN